MALRIIWNRLYSAQLRKQAEVAVRIQSHYDRKELEKGGVTVANVRYVSHSFNAPSILTACSPTGWHGESGAAKHGGHVTVHFEEADGRYKTHHVYRTDEAYKRQ